MKLSAAAVLVLSCGLALAAAGCGRSGVAASCRHVSPRTPIPTPEVVLTPEEKAVWAPLPPDRSAVPVLVYHGIGAPSDFSNAADADYGVSAYDFAKQMTMIKHAGYQTIGLQTFVDFVRGLPVKLPPRPLLLTFDDGRADSWTGSESILKKLGFTAVMFVDVGRVSACDPEYLTWDELRAMETGRPLEHAAARRTQRPQYIRYGSSTSETGPYYTYKKPGEDFSQWQDRVRSDIEAGQKELADTDSGVQAARLRPSLRGLRAGGDERRADPLRSPRLAQRTLRGGVHAGRERVGSSGLVAASRPHPGHARDERWPAPLPAADRQPVARLRPLRRRCGSERLPDDAHDLLARALGDGLEAAQLEPRELDAAVRPHRQEAEVGEEVARGRSSCARGTARTPTRPPCTRTRTPRAPARPCRARRRWR